MELGVSYRKRFLWQIAGSELASIQVAIKRSNLVNPIKSTSPLNRLFDPERHALIVHLNKENTKSGSIFNVDGVVCNKEVTPDRSLDRRNQNKSPSQYVNRDCNKERRMRTDVSLSDQSSDDCEVGSPRIYTRNSHPKCCRDLFLKDELKVKLSKKSNSKIRSSKGSGVDRSYSSKDIASRASTSGCNVTRGSRSSSRCSSASVGIPASSARRKQKVGSHQQYYIESKQKQERYKSSKDHQESDRDDHSPGTSTSYSIRYQTSKVRHAYDKDTSRRQKQPSSKSSSSKLAAAAARDRDRMDSASRDRSRHRLLSDVSVSSRSGSGTTSADNRRQSTRSLRRRTRSARSRSASRSRSRSLTPLRPGEFRPGKRKRDGGRQAGDYPHHPMPAAAAAAFQGAFAPPPPFARHLYPGPRAPLMFPSPFIQYVPVVGAARLPWYQPPAARPPKVYNNRPIPHFAPTPRLTAAHAADQSPAPADSSAPTSTSTPTWAPTVTLALPLAASLDAGGEPACSRSRHADPDSVLDHTGPVHDDINNVCQ